MRTTEFVLVYATFPDAATAEQIAATLIGEKLIACANIFPPMTSIYAWKGKTERTTEVAALFKTRRQRAVAAIARAKAQHPYETPCFLILPVEGGQQNYLEWLRTETMATPRDA